MNNYLKAAGYSEYNTEGIIYRFIRNSVIKPEYLTTQFDLGDGTTLTEYRMPANAYIGICAAVLKSSGEFEEIQYYYPYFNSPEVSTAANCIIESHTMSELYSGSIDDYNIGLSLIFFLSNPINYRLRKLYDGASEFQGTALAAFANEATVLLPVVPQADPLDPLAGMDVSSIFDADEPILSSEDDETELIDDYIESSLDMYDQINERIESEDLYSLVEQSFIPCGVECDQYSVIGEITDYIEQANALTDERLALIKLSCNNVEFWLCMRKEDILGEPQKGRRLKCRIWLTGTVNVGC